MYGKDSWPTYDDHCGSDGDDSVEGSIKNVAIHTGSRGKGLLGSANALAVFVHTISYTVT